MRKQALDSQLIDTRAELQKLKAYQQQLETRNALLEKVSRINNQPDQTSSSDEVGCHMKNSAPLIVEPSRSLTPSTAIVYLACHLDAVVPLLTCFLEYLSRSKQPCNDCVKQWSRLMYAVQLHECEVLLTL